MIKIENIDRVIVTRHRLILFALMVLLPLATYAYVFATLWVGETSQPMEISPLHSYADVDWNVSPSAIGIVLNGSGLYRTATINSYYNGTAYVTCTWKEKNVVGNGWTPHSQTWEIECQDNPVSIYPKNLSLAVGQTGQVSYSHQFTNQYTSGANVYFSSSNPNIATVDRYGYVTALNQGETYVTVYSNISSQDASRQSCRVEVKRIDPESVSIPSNLTVYVEEEETLTPTLQPSDAQTTFTWYSTDETKATVTDGKVRGRDEGSTQVYCRTANGLESNRCNVRVLYRQPTGIEVTPSSATINLYQTKQLSYTVKPSNARTTVTWHSEDVNEDVIRLSSSGLVTPVAGGTARVYAQTDNGYKSYSTITVLPDPSSISIPQKMLVMYGDNRTIRCTVEPSNAYASLNWESDNPSVARVNSQGEIEGVSGGSANITVSTHNGKSATCYVEVPEPDHRIYVWLNDGASVSYPLKDHPKITFSDDKVVLDGSGTHAEFDKTDFSRFTLADDMVSPMPSAIEMPSSLNMVYGDTYQIPYTLQPIDFDFETSLEWTTTDNHVVTVSKSGYLRAVGGGEADIILEASNGCKAQCHVTIPDPEFYLVVWLVDGRKAIVHLREKPMLRYEDNVYTLVSNNAEVKYSAEEVRKITLANNPDGEVTESNKDVIVNGKENVSKLDAETLIISDGRRGAATNVYTISGLLAATFSADDLGTTYIPMSQLSAGVLIIKSETITLKIIKK